MKHHNLFFPIVGILLLALVFSAPGQVKTEGMAVGLAAGTAVGDMDFGSDDYSGLNANFYFRFPLTGFLEGQLGTTFPVNLKREDENAFKTTGVSFDARLLIRFVNAQTAGLYGYGGIGALRFDNEEPPDNITPEAKEDGWTMIAPVGLGVQFRLSDRASLDISGGYTFAFTDDLNLWQEDADDRYFSGMAGITLTGEDANADSDGDGLTNGMEKQLGTDKKNPDSDGDGLTDGEEFTTHKTDPLKADTDGDGLSDYDEVKTHSTNPGKADTDGDGLDDKAEVMTHGTDPLKADTDGDGLNDYDELMTHKTDPNKADTDGDGLKDGDEVTKHKTDPMKADTDGDGLNDSEEVLTHKTDPNKADTDGGTVNDGTEVSRGTDPLDADDDVIKVAAGAAFILEGVNFVTGKADITPESEASLQKTLRTLKAYPEVTLEIRGYTDSVGSRAANIALSQRRADSVRQWLINNGIDASRLTAKGYGPDNPVADNGTPEGRAKNRRIEFYRIK